MRTHRRSLAAAVLLSCWAGGAGAALVQERCAWQGGPLLPDLDDVVSTPVVADLDGDGDSEIVAVAHDASAFGTEGALVILDGQCTVLAQVGDPGCRACVGATSCIDLDRDDDGAVLRWWGVALGDLDDDGLPEIVAVLGPEAAGLRARRLIAFRGDGSFFWCSEAYANPISPSTSPLDEGVPAIADLDGDGVPEIVVGGTIWSADGRLLAADHGAPRRVPSATADLDADGVMEVVVGPIALRADASRLWARTDLFGGFVSGSAPADLDGDGRPEVVMARDATDEVHVLDGPTGATRASATTPGDDPGCVRAAGAPAVGDLDGDGDSEIVVNMGTHTCRLDWITGPPEALQLAWCVPIGDCGSPLVTPILADVDGDGSHEILVRDEETLWILDADGTALDDHPSSSFTAWDTVVAAELDGDCRGELVVVADDLGPSFTHRGVRVFEGDDQPLPAWRPAWTQAAYASAHVTDTGALVPDPPAPSTFLAQVTMQSKATVSASRTMLWPPTHRLMRVRLTSDDGSPVSVLSVRQDEPLDDRGDGSHGPDAVIDGDGVLLRAERDGRGDGRTYHVEVSAGAGPCPTVSIVTVCVPHDRRPGRRGAAPACVDQGPLFDSTR